MTKRTLVIYQKPDAKKDVLKWMVDMGFWDALTTPHLDIWKIMKHADGGLREIIHVWDQDTFADMGAIPFNVDKLVLWGAFQYDYLKVILERLSNNPFQTSALFTAEQKGQQDGFRLALSHVESIIQKRIDARQPGDSIDVQGILTELLNQVKAL